MTHVVRSPRFREFADLARRNGAHDLAAMYDEQDRQHRMKFGEVVGRHVYGNGPGEFVYIRRKLSAAEIAAGHDRELQALHRRQEAEWRTMNKRHEREARDIDRGR